jgi:hypothetical protein
MVSVPSPVLSDPLDSELATLHARRAAVAQLIADLERYASLNGESKKRPANVVTFGQEKGRLG